MFDDQCISELSLIVDIIGLKKYILIFFPVSIYVTIYSIQIQRI